MGRHGVREPGVALLAKPFAAADLVRKVREVLDGAAWAASGAAGASARRPAASGARGRAGLRGPGSRTEPDERREGRVKPEWLYNVREGGIPRELARGVRARVFPGERVMLSVVEIEPWSESPVHAHPNEQWGVCLEGAWIRIQDGVEYPVQAGDVWWTPPDVPHGGRTLGQRCVVLDVFAPPREEYRRPGRGLGDARLAQPAAAPPDPGGGASGAGAAAGGA